MNPPFDFSNTNLVVAGVITFLVGSMLGMCCGYFISRWRERNIRAALNLKAQDLIDKAQREAQSIVQEGRIAANYLNLKMRAEIEQLTISKNKEIAAGEQRLGERECLVNRQLDKLVHEEQKLRDAKNQCETKQAELDKLHAESTNLVNKRREELARISKLDEAEIRAAYLKQIEQESLRDAVQLSQHILDDAKAKAEDKARRILCTAIQRYAGNHVFETSTATVTIGNEEMKGRIIGREGRNIRAFEAATGITVLIDDTPGAVVLSGFDPVRREIAREAMERLILDGRIHPARIEEVVATVSQEIDEVILHAGEDAVMKVGLTPLHTEVVKLLGRLRFRNSFSQNILQHSMEVAQLTGLMAAEVGLDVATARRIGLLHDIGKAVSHEVEGPHALVGAEILKRHGESDIVTNAVAAHHGEAPAEGLLSVLVSAADAISASRPGARSETILTYIKRVDDLEKIGLSFSGVEKCYALQAGRELRVMVQPNHVSDDEAFIMARNISRKIENELQYPGQIRVTIVRETRCVEFAK